MSNEPIKGKKNRYWGRTSIDAGVTTIIYISQQLVSSFLVKNNSSVAADSPAHAVLVAVDSPAHGTVPTVAGTRGQWPVTALYYCGMRDQKTINYLPPPF